MPAGNMPAAEVEADARLVRRLVAAQFPRWAPLAVRTVPSIGWDNLLFRLGSEMLVRLPRREMAAELVEKEHRWLPVLAPGLPLPIPVPIGRGRPGEGFPWRWSVCPWMPGRISATSGLRAPVEFATALGRFVTALHQPAPPDAPIHPFDRGAPLRRRDEEMRDLIDEHDGPFDRATLARAWDLAMDLPDWDGPPLWLHGDLHPANLLVHRNRLRAVLDFGDLCVGDPAVDLITGWMGMDRAARRAFRDSAGVDDHTWARGRAWALMLGVAVLSRSADNPVIASMAERGVAAALADLGLT
jgi:aminoglycoside phosphotransferase (APT) family kinase protein